MALQKFFPFVPDYMSWEDWNGNMLVFFDEEPIPYNTEEDWLITANNVAQLPSFASYPVPSGDTFPDWQSWAREFSLIINGPTQ